MSESSVPVVIVGSVALDTIETPRARRDDILGGSASYACAAASFFGPSGMVGIVGTDFSSEWIDLFDRFGIDREGLQIVEGKTFRWSGVYEENMDNRRTLSTDLNVFADFTPDLPQSYRGAPFVLLGNISPDLQDHVLGQVDHPRFVVADTMDLWIDVARDALTRVIEQVHMLMLNESEARHYTGEHNLIAAAEALLALGPDYVLIKKGEHGSILFARETTFVMPAYPLREVEDPTGAGDSFAGAFVGALAEAGSTEEGAMRRALAYGNIVASFGVGSFSLETFRDLAREQIEERLACFREIIDLPG